MRTVSSGDDVQVGLRMPRALREQLERLAVAHQSSVSGATRYLLRRGLEQLDHELSQRAASDQDAPRAPKTPPHVPVAVGGAR